MSASATSSNRYLRLWVDAQHIEHRGDNILWRKWSFSLLSGNAVGSTNDTPLCETATGKYRVIRSRPVIAPRVDFVKKCGATYQSFGSDRNVRRERFESVSRKYSEEWISPHHGRNIRIA